MLVAGALLGAAAPARAADPVVATAGDIACGPAETGVFPCQQQATSDLLFTTHPDAVLALGDNQYNSGSLPDYENFYDPTWGRMKAITHPVIGNHEYGTGGAGYWDYYNGGGQDTGPAGQRNQGWYSFDLGAWHLIALNGNCASRVACGPGSPQETWLKADLKAHPAACTLAFEHQPLWAGPAFATPEVRPLFQDLYDAQAEIFLVAHDHLYERFAPSTPSQTIDNANGVQQFIVGTGGRDLSGAGAFEPNAQVRDNKTFGVLKLTLHPSSYDWQFVPIGGQGFTDSGSRACHGPSAPPPAAQPPPPPPPPPPAPPGLAPNPPAASPPEAEDQLSRVTTRLTVASSTRGRIRIVIHGRLTTGADARRLRLTLSRRTKRHGRIVVTARARGGRSGAWRAEFRLPPAVRGLRKFRLTIRYLGEPTYTAESLALTIRPRRP
ncbi:MAG TPA: metallophosphoesterase [Solirubrobacteraceae bacterium]